MTFGHKDFDLPRNSDENLCFLANTQQATIANGVYNRFSSAGPTNEKGSRDGSPFDRGRECEGKGVRLSEDDEIYRGPA